MSDLPLRTGPHNDVTDILGVKVGQATDQWRKTGVTVIELPDDVIVSGDVRGGGPGTRETDLLDPSCMVQHAHGFVFSGGSAFGLAAADGVMHHMADIGRGFDVAQGRNQLLPKIPILPTAIIFDLLTGDQTLGLPEYPSLGRLASSSVQETPMALGRVGAGTGAIAGDRPGGVGSASVVVTEGALSGCIVAALVIANPVGVVIEHDGAAIGAPYLFPEDTNNTDIKAQSKGNAIAPKMPKLAGLLQNTSIGAVITNAKLNKAEAKRMAIMAHDGLARAIRPVHTPYDGDTIFSAATGAVRLAQENRALSVAHVGSLAADCVSRAVIRAVL